MPVYKHNKPTADGRIWRFQVSYKTADGKYHNYKSGLYMTKKEAEKEEARWILQNKTNPRASLLTFNDIIPEYLANKKSAVKPQSYDHEVVLCNHVSRLIGGIVISKMTATQYENFRQQILDTENWSIVTKNKVDKQLKTLIDYAERKYDITNTIPKKYPQFKDNAPKRQMQILTLEEFEKFAEHLSSPYLEYFTFLMFTGARMNEANALTWNDIDFKEGTANIHKTVVAKIKSKEGLYVLTTPKTPSSIRIIPLAKRALEALKTRQEEQKKLEKYSDEWFCFGGSRPLPETSIRKVKDAALKAAELHPVRVHDFRHSYVSMLVNNLGVDNILLISRLVGHSSVQETLKTYSHLWHNSLTDYVKKINEL